MPVQRTAEPGVSEFSERRARLDGILAGFGFDPALIDQKLREINSTPMGPGFYTGGLSTINADSTADEKAFSIAAWFFFSRYAQSTSNGLDGLCDSDRRLTGAIQELFRGSYYMGGALQINDKAEAFLRVESESYGLNLDNLRNASLFQLWASQQGGLQETIDMVGAQLFGAEWEYGRIAGSRFSPPDRDHTGTYYFKTDNAIEIRQAYVSIAASPAEATVSGITPVRTGEAQLELTPEQEFSRFFSMNRDSMFSDNVQYFFRDTAKDYRRAHRRDGTSLTTELLEEATAFYVWASGMDSGEPRLSSEEMESMGSQKYGGVWEFGRLTAENLMLASRGRNEGKFIFETTDNVAVVRDGFASLTVPTAQEAPATVASAGPATAESSSRLAELAASVGVSEDYLVRAATLMKQGSSIVAAFDSSTAEGEMRETRMAGGKIGIYYGGGPGEHDNTALLRAVQRARDLV
ncbi:MAG: hypothetical protein NTY83_00105 [Candidatus Micrarchaeota archaeon]|nr:hypothetical protein [Candidatus Micrarchaeota archaeon]